MVAVFDTFTFGFRHKVKVDGLTGDNGEERTIFHNDEAVAEFRKHKSGLGGNGVFDDFGRFDGDGRCHGGWGGRLGARDGGSHG